MSSSGRLTYIFKDTGLAGMKSFIDQATLFAFDLDGTLAPIADDPDTIGIPGAIREEFAVLNEQAAVAVITGRSRSDARMYVGAAPRYLIGNHGAEGLPGWEDREDQFIRTASQWQSQLDALLPIANRAGIVVENKGATLSIHYRHAGRIRLTHALILCTIDRLVPRPRRISGKYVENLIPNTAPDKGVALQLLMQQAGFPKGFFVGDDETDEDVFRLDNENIFTIRVGRRTGSRASFYLRGQHEIIRLLREINRNLGQIKEFQHKLRAPGNIP
jgi:trehalose 6-phosphate phosphatase